MSDTIPANFGRIIKRTATAVDYTIVPSDDYVVATVTGKVLTLPAAASVPAGWVVTIATSAPGSVSATVTPASGDTIGGIEGSLTISSTSAMVELVSDGVSNWEGIRAGA